MHITLSEPQDFVKSPNQYLNRVIGINPLYVLERVESSGIKVDSRVDIIVSRVEATFLEHLPVLESLPDIASKEFIHESDGALVRFIGMIQHDSLGEQFYVPFGLDGNGNVCNIGLFAGSRDDGRAIIKYSSDLAGRRMVVVMSPPHTNVRCQQKYLALIYNDKDTRVNDLVEIYGILDCVRDNEDDQEYPNTLPKIHVLSMQPYHLQSKDVPDICITKAQISSSLHTYGFCQLSAEKLICSLLSRVANRTTGIMSSLLIGNYPLNIRIKPGVACDGIVRVLTSMASYSTVLNLSLDTLERSAFVSKMNYETGELEQGLLQVPDGTLILIDERLLDAGNLSELATRNIQALIELISHQRVHYDFGGQDIPINMDVPIISISYGKSILPVP